MEICNRPMKKDRFELLVSRFRHRRIVKIWQYDNDKTNFRKQSF